MVRIPHSKGTLLKSGSWPSKEKYGSASTLPHSSGLQAARGIQTLLPWISGALSKDLQLSSTYKTLRISRLVGAVDEIGSGFLCPTSAIGARYDMLSSKF